MVRLHPARLFFIILRHRSPTGRGGGLRNRTVEVRILPVVFHIWGDSSTGRASGLHPEDVGFNSRSLHCGRGVTSNTGGCEPPVAGASPAGHPTGCSSMDERRTRDAEDAGSSPAGLILDSCVGSSMAEHLRAMQEMRVRLPPGAFVDDVSHCISAR